MIERTASQNITRAALLQPNSCASLAKRNVQKRAASARVKLDGDNACLAVASRFLPQSYPYLPPPPPQVEHLRAWLNAWPTDTHILFPVP